MNRSSSTDTHIQTIGGAILMQSAIRYAAYVAITWLALSYADAWVMAWLQ